MNAKQLLESYHALHESVFNLLSAGRYSGAATPSVRMVKDVLNAKRLKEGTDYYWEGPYILHIDNKCVDRDITAMISLQGGVQVPEVNIENL